MDDMDWKRFASGFYRAVLNGCDWFVFWRRGRDGMGVTGSHHFIPYSDCPPEFKDACDKWLETAEVDR